MFFEIFVILVLKTGVSLGKYNVGVLYDLSEWSLQDLPNINVSVPTNNVTPYQYYLDGSDVFNITRKVCDLSGTEILGFITFTSCNKGLILSNHASSLNLPHVLVTKEEKPCILSSSQPTLSILTDCRLLNGAFLSIASHKNWKAVNIIYDDSYDEYCIQYLVDQFSSAAIFSTTFLLSNDSDIEASLSSTERGKETVIFTALNVNKTIDTILKASSFEMFSRQYFWVFSIDPNLLWDIHEPDALQNGNVLTVSRNIAHKMDSSLSDIILSDVIMAYRHSLQLMLSYNSSYSIGTYDCDSNRPTPGGSQLHQSLLQTSLQEILGTSSWTSAGSWDNTIYIHSCQAGQNVTFSEVATYNYLDGFRVQDDRLFKNLFKDFGNRTLTVVSWTSTPFTIRGLKGNNSIYYYGFCYDIFNEFAKVFNFRYVTIDSVDGTYGGPTANGTNGTGMVGMVMRGEADIGVGPFTVTASRETVIDFLTPFQEEGVGIIMKTVDQKADQMFRMFLPFQSTSWIATGMSIVVTGFILSIVSRLSPYTRDADKPIHQNVWLAFGAFFGQMGGDSTPTSASGKVVLGIWWMCTILILELYTANLAAYLTIPPAKSPIKNLEQLAASSDYKPLVKTGSNLDFLFKRAKGGLYKQIREKMEDMPVIKTTEAGYDLVKTGKYAYMTDVSQLTYKVLKDCQSMLVAEETFNKAGLSFIIREDAEFKTAFNLHMITMIEAGLIAKFRSKWWPLGSECDALSSKKSATELQIDSMAGIFIVYGAFTGLAILAFVAEILFAYYIYPFLRHKRIQSAEKIALNDSS
ncbi:glutamate receptor ionotropic, delta-1-like [Saccostrea echinata]|uniref:glutamate receptor ionotropic, delta-1-like n=1 Tax=Saccostrea echinata TaxID=191078 RepID=UPI002A7F19DA|nr:glutamate receptor ionotropic, delta-1-like [Saccostrea echinata]